MLLPRFLLLIILLFNFMDSHAQGCSDAGFCTMGAMKPDQPFNKKLQVRLRSMEISFYRGTTTATPIVYVANADMSFSLNSKNSFQLKLPYQTIQSGNFGETGGLGDISLCLTRNLFTSERFDINLSIGAKIPSNDSNLKAEGRFEGKPLPMYYQTSLGTYDAISGISVLTKNWLFATGIQIPLNENNNQFLWEEWSDYPEQSYLEKYGQAKELKRGVDIMLRAERNFRFSQFNFSAGILPIYRVTNDEITGPTGARVKPEGARGLALSGIVTAGYNLNVRNSIRLLVGHKIIQRDRNPDGLTRVLVTTFSYNYRF
ncbi:MAG: hypothetical protein O9262_15360 [Cyclobacteriaceae bacterium]|nr:hypothetical protein [Cyclobacteriaceae bacterium]